MASRIACLLTLTLVAAARGADPICCTPAQWTGGFGSFIGANSNGTNLGTSINGILTYDLTNQRIAALEQITGSDGFNNIRLIDDHKAGKRYIINNDDNSCTVETLDGAMEAACIPGDSTFTATVVYGLGANTLPAKNYIFEADVLGMQASYSVSVTDGCIPMGGIVIGGNADGSTGFQGTGGIFNVTAGVRDPSVFDVPSNCQATSAAATLSHRDLMALDFTRRLVLL